MLKKFFLLIFFSLLTGAAGWFIGLEPRQVMVISVFAMSVLGTLFFWDFRLSFVFIGSGLLLLMNAVNLEDFIRFASLDVILFLIAMMIILGMMKDAGFFLWLVTLVLRIKRLNGLKLYVIVMTVSAVLSGIMDEVTSIIIMVTVILDICDFLEVNPVPLLISSILATNIGSASTVLGNPVGVLIAARGRLSFEDFLIHAVPVSAVALVFSIVIICFFFRRSIQEVDNKLSDYQENKSFLYLISIPPDRKTKMSIGIFLATIILIGLHKRIELFFNLMDNTLLIMTPIIFAGIVMIYRHDKARHYIEREVEWPSILFFMFLFAQAGVIQASGIACLLAERMIQALGRQPDVLSGVVLFSGAFLSSCVDNVVAVAAYVPIIQSLEASDPGMKSLWWALLFGACYGGNVTLIGSTANIVAISMLDKEKGIKIDFMQWFKIGSVVGMVTIFISLLALIFIPLFKM